MRNVVVGMRWVAVTVVALFLFAMITGIAVEVATVALVVATVVVIVVSVVDLAVRRR